MFSQGYSSGKKVLYYDTTLTHHTHTLSKNTQPHVNNFSGFSSIKGVYADSYLLFVDFFPTLKVILFCLYGYSFTIILMSIFLNKKSLWYIPKISIFLEKQTMSVQEFLVFFFFYGTTISNLFFFILKFMCFLGIGYCFLVFNLLFILTLVISAPVFFFLNAGLFGFCLLTGSLKSSSFFRNIFDDFFSATAYIIKYWLQIARWCLIVGVIFLTNENLYFSLPTNNLFSFDQLTTLTNYTPTSLSEVISSIVVMLFKTIDTMFLLIIQSSLFFVLIFIVLSFMFSSSIVNFVESIKR